MLNKLVMISCWLNMVGVALMAYYSYGANKHMDAMIQQKAQAEIHRRAQEICDQCIKEFARKQGLRIVGIEEP